MQMLPWLTGRRPMIARSVVVLPAPFGPMIVVSALSIDQPQGKWKKERRPMLGGLENVSPG